MKIFSTYRCGNWVAHSQPHALAGRHWPKAIWSAAGNWVRELNAWANLTPGLALEQAHAAEKEIAAGHYRGPLHGIPYALKDLVAVKGYPTTWGAPPSRDRQFDYNAVIVEKLNAAGAVLIGKAAMIELAGGLGYSNGSASLTGPARNPWNPECWTCGSSSGSGAVVSARHGALGDRQRHARLHHLSNDMVRNLGNAAHPRPCQHARRDGDCVVHG